MPSHIVIRVIGQTGQEIWAFKFFFFIIGIKIIGKCAEEDEEYINRANNPNSEDIM